MTRRQKLIVGLVSAFTIALGVGLAVRTSQSDSHENSKPDCRIQRQVSPFPGESRTLVNADNRGRVPTRLGAILFLCGLVIVFIAWQLADRRMGPASHNEGVMNGTFLIAVGLPWDRLRLGRPGRTALFWPAFYGTHSSVAAIVAQLDRRHDRTGEHAIDWGLRGRGRTAA